MKKKHLLLTCEHASYHIPKAYQAYFDAGDVLAPSHQAYDAGAFQLYTFLCKQLKVSKLFYGKVRRLIVDLNRSLTHKQLFSKGIRQLPLEVQQHILQRYYHPYYQSIYKYLDRQSKSTQVLHVAIHSFTPCLNGVARNNDIGILYDPSRIQEKELAKQWKACFKPEFKVRNNYPYLGIADGLATQLRRRYPKQQYLGFELECNQDLLNQPKRWQELKKLVLCSLQQTLN